uniref:Uncharacterized protein n=1 Tax=Romanomermis culicivorax TaxID=13658 RepID=A0A915KSP3_ROMCU
PSGAVLDFEGIDVDQLSGVTRVFGALFTKLGVPIPTQITPKILNSAKEICENKQQENSSEISLSVPDLEFGREISGRVDRQDGKFFRLM